MLSNHSLGLTFLFFVSASVRVIKLEACSDFQTSSAMDPLKKSKSSVVCIISVSINLLLLKKRSENSDAEIFPEIFMGPI